MQSRYGNIWQEETHANEKLHTLFELSAKKHPDNIALVYKNESLTFRELNEKADNLCHAILNWAYYDDFIGVSTSPSADLVVSILAILKSGKAFLPIDPKASIKRNAQIVSDSGLNFCLAKENEFESLNNYGLKIIFSDSERNFRTIVGKRLGQMAYMMYTSGSTCRPKGVKVEHKSIVHYLKNAIEEYASSDNNSGSYLQLSLSFDASLTSLFVPLCCGKTVVIADSTCNNAFNDPNFMKHIPYDFLKITPLQFSWLEHSFQGRALQVCKHIVVGGENLHTRHFEFLRNKGLDTDIINEYGPTETTVGCMNYRFGLNDHYIDSIYGIPIGKAMKGNEILILNEKMEAVGPGEVGEIYISGPQLSAGYLMRPDLNEQLFVEHPYDKNRTVFKTGDFATIHEDGTAVYLDRAENHISIEGVKVDFNKIEWELSKLEGVKQCEVVCKELNGKKRLIAYLMPDQAGLDIESLPQLLSGKISESMMPQKFIVISEWPYTAHGKLNKHGLPIPLCGKHKNNSRRMPGSIIEKQIADIWCELLNINDTDIDTGFFEMGGNHILADRLVRTLKSKHQYNVDLTMIYRCSSISCLSKEIEKQTPTTVQDDIQQSERIYNLNATGIQAYH